MFAGLSLTELRVGNCVGPDGAAALAGALTHNGAIQKFSLHCDTRLPASAYDMVEVRELYVCAGIVNSLFDVIRAILFRFTI
jgi:hypothetical protein